MGKNRQVDTWDPEIWEETGEYRIPLPGESWRGIAKSRVFSGDPSYDHGARHIVTRKISGDPSTKVVVREGYCFDV